jgi:hypothetical protein
MPGDLITWTELGVLFAGLSGGVGIWKIRAADRRHYDDKLDAQAKEVADFKLQVATMHPTMKEIAAIEERLTLALNRLADRLDRLLERDVK